ncbi:MAG: exodeoxyribonuclease VII large subunit, partial [Planctomycetaceae bacterium]
MPASNPPILSVSELTRQLKDLVEVNFVHVWVLGEVSNCTRAGSGHVYFTLKDGDAQIRAVAWRSQTARWKFEIHDGLEVVVAGPIEVYPARGTYQLIVEQLIPQGVGALELAFRQLQAKLEAEGLFDPRRKRPLPAFPRRIALVTSPSGAAVRDILQVLTRRWRAVDVVIVPVKVQGEGAAREIAAALANVHRIPDVDVVIAGRGGGSLEDLWAFNEEIVARAIAACRVPVISAVGHEIDVSIADLVADCRALTPSEAAELVVPNCEDVLN